MSYAILGLDKILAILRFRGLAIKRAKLEKLCVSRRWALTYCGRELICRIFPPSSERTVPDQNDRSADVTDTAAPDAAGTDTALREIPLPERIPEPVLDFHPPHHAANSWRDFFVHIATIVIGLLIAVGLEQTVEWVHPRHQRHQLQ